MNKDELDFSVFCVESVAERINLSGEVVYNLLAESGILDDYIVPNYKALHTQGKDYIVSDIVDYMGKEGLLK